MRFKVSGLGAGITSKLSSDSARPLQTLLATLGFTVRFKVSALGVGITLELFSGVSEWR